MAPNAVAFTAALMAKDLELALDLAAAAGP